MDSNRSRISSHYDRVMPRVYNKSDQKLEKRDVVTRHSRSKSGKNSVSNVSCSATSDLPVVLHDYEPEERVDKQTKRSYIVKPRRTLKSLDPPDSVLAKRLITDKACDKNVVKTPRSAPVVSKKIGRNMNIKRAIVSETSLKELKDEIKTFDNSAKLSTLRSKLFKSCGVLLDEYGQVSIDKGVQVCEDQDLDVSPKSSRLVLITPALLVILSYYMSIA